MKKTFELSELYALGELAYRIHKSQSRLETAPYRPQDCFEKETGYDWPADWVGRALLGNAIISRASKSESAYTDGLFETALKLRNEKGYLGEILPEGTADEQQLSGHNWLLRGLLEYGKMTGSEQAAKFASDIVENLYLPAADFYASYPCAKEERVFEGGKSGTRTENVIGHWVTSTDTGCAFMCLDALADYYAMTGSAEVSSMLDKMIAKFIQIDFAGIQMQTHASLSAARGILKYYEATEKKELLDFAVKFAELYKNYGMCANYANYNWFCRAAWTEPCAIVDSYMLFENLFTVTGDGSYAETAERIYLNALRFAQRANGGFGTDKCTDSQCRVLAPDGTEGNLNEAFWCCSMRGGEGLARVLQNSFRRENNNIFITGSSDAVLKTDGLNMKVRNSFGKTCKINISYEKSESCGFDNLYVYVPEGISCERVTSDGEKIGFEKDVHFLKFEINSGKHSADVSYTLCVHTEKHSPEFRKEEGTVCLAGDMIIGIAKENAEEYEGIPEFEIGEDGVITDKKTGLRGELTGKNIDSLTETGLKPQSMRIVF